MTREFQDALGRAWTINITCSSLKRITANAGFDIAEIGNGKALELFSGSTTHLLDILWPLVAADAGNRGISEESFGDGLRGDAITGTVKALKEELLDFFPSARRHLMQRLLAKMETVLGQAGEKALADIDAAQASLVTGGNSPTSVRESSEESVPTSGPSENS